MGGRGVDDDEEVGECGDVIDVDMSGGIGATNLTRALGGVGVEDMDVGEPCRAGSERDVGMDALSGVCGKGRRCWPEGPAGAAGLAGLVGFVGPRPAEHAGPYMSSCADMVRYCSRRGEERAWAAIMAACASLATRLCCGRRGGCGTEGIDLWKGKRVSSSDTVRACRGEMGFGVEAAERGGGGEGGGAYRGDT